MVVLDSSLTLSFFHDAIVVKKLLEPTESVVFKKLLAFRDDCLLTFGS